MNKALIIVDVQYDFLPGGALEVAEGDRIIPVINHLQTHFSLIVATQDWHPADHGSFASRHAGKSPFEKSTLDGLDQILWPDHCVQGSQGAEFHRDLHTKKVAAIFRKGMDTLIDSYSGFYDNAHRQVTGMGGYLRQRQVEEVFVCGLAADFCVGFTILDALKEGFKTSLIEDGTRPINREGFEKMKKDIRELNGKVINAEMAIRS